MASSPAYRWTKPGISPVANSRCRRSSNSRIVRMVRYASSTCSRVMSPAAGGATADMDVSSWGRALEASLTRRVLPGRCIAGGRTHHRVDVDRQRPGDEPDGRLAVRPALDLALAVEGDRARPGRDRDRRPELEDPVLGHADADHEAGRERDVHDARRLRRVAREADVQPAPAP